MIFLTMLIIPTLVALGFFLFSGRKFTLLEFLTQLGVQTVLMGMVCYGVSCQNTHDTELLNGRVQSKAKERVSCEHSYTCNCVESCSSDGKGGESCTTICQTCYEHSYDIDWAVYLNIGSRLTIDRVDRQGLSEPQRWADVVIGEPGSVTHGYTNYIKGSPDTLFRHQGLVEKYEKEFPQYPQQIYDYYRINRLVDTSGLVTNVQEWNKSIAELNGDLGPAKQASLALVVLKNKPEDFYDALEEKWIGGKKNDIVVVINVDDAGKITWTNVMAWTDNKIFQVKIRDDINTIGQLSVNTIMAAVEADVKLYYVRKPMKDFEYLKNLIRPTTGQWVFAMLFGLILSVGLGIYFHENDPFNEEERGYYGYRR